MLYYKKKDIEKFITSKDGKYIVTSYGALLLVYAVILLIIIVAIRVLYITFFKDCQELSIWDALSGISALIGGIGILAWGKSFDVKAANYNTDSKNTNDEESTGIKVD